MGRANWAPRSIDLSKPSSARIYDYLLGGACNSASDRAVAKRMLAAMPEIKDIARLNRAFLRRLVPYLVGAGIRQFLDIGSGIPNIGNVHEIAQKLDPECRVVYVDNDPIAIAHGELLLRDNDRAGTVAADFRHPDDVLGAPVTTGLLDFDQPVAVLSILMLHYISDSQDPASTMARYRDALAPGSYLALSHPTTGAVSGLDDVADIMRSSVEPVTVRTREQISRIIEGFDPVEPGIVYLPQWHPDSPLDVGDHPERSLVYGVVGVKH